MSDLSNRLDEELKRLEIEESSGKGVLVSIFKVLEEKVAGSKDIAEVTKEIKALREKIEQEEIEDRKQLKELIEKLIKEVGNRPEPIKQLDVNVKNPTNEVSIKNKKIAIDGEVGIKEGSDILKSLRGLVAPLVAVKEAIGEILRVEIVGNSDPKKPISVRLSDGNKFYNAIYQAFSSSGWHVPFKKSNGVAKEGLVDDDGRLIIRIGAEDIATGNIELVQGQFNANGNFELLTAGSGASSNEGIGYWIIETDFVVS